MRQITNGVWQHDGLLPHIINCYLVATPEGDVLIDAGTRWCTGSLLRALRGRNLSMVALTHVHPDHQGAAAEICQRKHVPLACHQADVDVMEGRQQMVPVNPVTLLGDLIWSGPTYPVTVRWQGGERFGDWEVIPAPGHTLGHVIYWRARDGVAIVGDVVRNASLRRGIGHMSETPHLFTVDLPRSRQSIKTLIDLNPKLLCFGHGPPSTNLSELKALHLRIGGLSE